MIMRADARKLQSHLAPQVEPEGRISEDVFFQAASRAWQASLKLAAMCSGLTTAELQSTFNLTNGVAMCEAQMEAEADALADEEGLSIGSWLWMSHFCTIGFLNRPRAIGNIDGLGLLVVERCLSFPLGLEWFALGL